MLKIEYSMISYRNNIDNGAYIDVGSCRFTRTCAKKTKGVVMRDFDEHGFGLSFDDVANKKVGDILDVDIAAIDESTTWFAGINVRIAGRIVSLRVQRNAVDYASSNATVRLEDGTVLEVWGQGITYIWMP